MTANTQSTRRPPGRRLAVVAAILVALVLMVYMAVGGVAASTLTLPDRTFNPERGATLGVPYQEVRFPARVDGVPIAGWYIPRAGSTRAVIMVHGKDQSRSAEFAERYPAGRFPELGAAVHAAGFSVLMIDLRGHGQSGDGRFSFGIYERRDVMGAADWLKSQDFKPGRIGVLGISLGAASAVGAAVEDTDIGALAVDSGFAEFCPVLQANWSSQSGLPDLLLPPTLLMTRVLYGYNVCDARPVAEIGRLAPRPVLIIHTVKDATIPMSDAERLAAAVPTAELWRATGYEHARNYNADPAAYVAKVTGFFDRGLAK